MPPVQRMVLGVCVVSTMLLIVAFVVAGPRAGKWVAVIGVR